MPEDLGGRRIAMEKEECGAVILEAGVGDTDNAVGRLEGKVWHYEGW